MELWSYAELFSKGSTDDTFIHQTSSTIPNIEGEHYDRGSSVNHQLSKIIQIHSSLPKN